MNEIQDLTLSPAELKSVTGYAKPIFQLRVLRELGIPARRRSDNTVLVLRMHMLHPSAVAAFVSAAPRLKSAKK